jgi:hypothetical protein
MEHAATVMARSAVDLLTNPELLKSAHQEHQGHLIGRKYRPLIPDATKPPIDINEKTMDKYRSLMAKFYKDF